MSGTIDNSVNTSLENLPGEVWTRIDDFEGKYEVSNKGRIKVTGSKYNKGTRIVKGELSNQGYYRIRVCYNGKIERKAIHRLVAICFIPNPNNYPIVNHKDQNPRNNNVENLEWCTQQYNAVYKDAVEKRSGKIRGRKREGRIVLQYSKEGIFIKEHRTLKDASIEMCGSANGLMAIQVVCRKKPSHHTAFGYQWRYKDSEDFPLNIGRAKEKAVSVIQYSLDWEFIKEYRSSNEAAKELGLVASNITRSCKNSNKSCGGFKWKYKEQ